MAPLRELQLLDEAAREHGGGEEIDLKDLAPQFHAGFEHAEARAALPLGRNRGIVDKRVKAAALRLQPLAHFGDGGLRVFRVGKIDLNVILRSPPPRGNPRERAGANR